MVFVPSVLEPACPQGLGRLDFKVIFQERVAGSPRSSTDLVITVLASTYVCHLKKPTAHTLFLALLLTYIIILQLQP